MGNITTRKTGRLALYITILATTVCASLPTHGAAFTIDQETCGKYAAANLDNALLVIINYFETLTDSNEGPTSLKKIKKIKTLKLAQKVAVKCIKQESSVFIPHPVTVDKNNPTLTINVSAMKKGNFSRCKVINKLAHGLAHLAGVPEGNQKIATDQGNLVGLEFQNRCESNDLDTTLSW